MFFVRRAAKLAAIALTLVSASTPSLAAQATAVPTAAEAPNVRATQTVPESAPAELVVETPAAARSATFSTLPTSFSTLDEAVAAQDVAATDEALRCLATAIFFESKGEPLAGQLAVAHVVLNRAESGRFAPDACGVVKQRGQFSFVRGGQLPAVNVAHRAWRTALAIAKVALADVWKSPAPNALFFHARAVGIGRGVKVASIGNHVFYR